MRAFDALSPAALKGAQQTKNGVLRFGANPVEQARRFGRFG
jgi:hypothetical protein